MPDQNMIIILAIVALIVISQLVFSSFLIKPWLKTIIHGFPISIMSIVLMRVRGNPPMFIVDAYIELKNQIIETKISQVEIAYLKNKHQITTSEDLVNFVKEEIETGQLKSQLSDSNQ